MIRDLLPAAPAIKSSAAQLLLLERYENVYGIYNHDQPDPRDPWAVVKFNAAEDSSTGSHLYERMERFVEREVTKYLGLSYREFISQPSDICEHQLEICLKRQSRKDQADTDVTRSLEASLAGKGA